MYFQSPRRDAGSVVRAIAPVCMSWMGTAEKRNVRKSGSKEGSVNRPKERKAISLPSGDVVLWYSWFKALCAGMPPVRAEI